jgi:hypothetical protein
MRVNALALMRETPITRRIANGFFISVLVLFLFLGLIPAFIARNKGRSFGAWWFYGFSLFLVALLHALLLRPDHAGIEGRQRAEGLKKCHFCTEMIKMDAIVCRYCGKDLHTRESSVIPGIVLDDPAYPRR